MFIFRFDFLNQLNDIQDDVVFNGCLGIYVVDSVCGCFIFFFCFLYCFLLKFLNVSIYMLICLKFNMFVGV